MSDTKEEHAFQLDELTPKQQKHIAKAFKSLRESLKGKDLQKFVSILTANEMDLDSSKGPKMQYQYIVARDFVTSLDGMKITIPKGFICDGCSGGVDAIATEGWLIHDWLYATHAVDGDKKISRETADSVLPWWRRAAIAFASTKLFACFGFATAQDAWNNSHSLFKKKLLVYPDLVDSRTSTK